MTTYLSQPIPVDRASIRQAIDERALALRPDLDVTSPLTTYDFLADLFATFHAEQLTTLTQQLAIAFRGSAEKVDRIVQRDAVQATATGTLTRTAADAAAGTRVVPAGTGFDLQGADGLPVAFETVNDTTFTGGATSVGSVALIASQGGADANGLSTVLGASQTVSWYQSLVLGGATSGGEDAEDDDEYLNRVADTRPGRAFTIVLPDDLSRFLRNQPGVDRALIIDRYDPNTLSFVAPGHITAIPIDETGAELSAPTMAALREAAQEISNTNLSVHIIAPTYTDVDVVFVGVAEPGFDPDDVKGRAETAVLNFLSPAQWGLPGSGDQADWIESLTVRHQDISTVLNNVQGFDHWTTLTINGVADDFLLTGPGGLPDIDSTATGTVTS